MRSLLQTPAVFLLLCAGISASPAQGLPPRQPLTPADVALALTAGGLPTQAAQVELPPGLTTSVPDPQLYLTAADLRPDGRLRLRLACRQSAACQPFLATLTSTQGPTGLALLQRSLVPAATPATHLRAGQHAILLLEDARMRITVPVLAIDSGAPGTTIRVSSLDRKQTYDGVVLDAGTIRGTLP